MMQFGSAFRVAIFGAALVACSGLPGRVWADQLVASAAPAGAIEAVGRAVQDGGQAFAGACASTQSPRDLGLVCARFVAEQSSVYAFETGRTFSEFNQWVFVTQQGDEWQVIMRAPLSDSVSGASIPWPEGPATSKAPGTRFTNGLHQPQLTRAAQRPT
jgi:hypothetical protein